MSDVKVTYLNDDARPPFIFSDAKEVELRHIKARHASGVPGLVLNGVEDFSIEQSLPLRDVRLKKALRRQF
jgi:hypothetical protein